MRNLVISALVILMATASFAQQQWQYSQYMNNNFMLNPAEGGTEDFADIKLGYRTQWVGLEGAPTSLFLSGHTPIGKESHRFEDVKPLAFHGVGGYVSSDQTGPTSRLSAYGSYSYHIPIGMKTIASFGAFLGIKQYKLDPSGLTWEDDQADNAVAGNLSNILPDASFGLWLYNPNYYLGISTFQLFQNEVPIAQEGGITESGSLAMHHFITAGYRIPIGEEEKINIIPSFVAKAAFPAPLQVDFNCKVRYEDKYWLGVSYRNQDSMILLAGLTVKDLIDIGYSFDVTLSNLQNYNTGSHEILLGYRWHHHEKPVPSQFW